MSTQMASENGVSAQNSMFAGQQSYFTQSINAGSYAVNTDLIAKTGKFTQPAVYQRLYP
jgi:5-methylcytosine-specific restriction protein B